MKTLILGPTFVLPVAEPPEVVADRLATWLADPACPFPGHRQGLHLQLAVPPKQRHRWSPWLTLEVREPLPMPHLPATVSTGANPPPEAEVFARFNPSPAIWTGYILASLAIITTMIGAAMWGLAQVITENPPTALWVVPIGVLALVVMWALSAAGQRLAADEMHAMRNAIESAIQ